MNHDVAARAREITARTGITLTRSTRGWYIGDTSKAIEGAARAASLDFEGQFRKARMVLASELLGREVESFNQLTDGELRAVHEWTTTNGPELKAWLEETFGKQLSLPGPYRRT